MLDRIEHGEILEIRLNRPPANALDTGLLTALEAALREAEAGGAAGVVLSGKPGLFTGGLDLPFLLGLSREEILEPFEAFFRLLSTAAGLGIPLAAAVTGHSPAGGAVIAQFCDHRVMARGQYVIGFSEAQIGVVMPRCLVRVLTLRLGWPAMADLVTSGRLVGPEEALSLGIVDELADPGKVVAAAVGRLEKLLSVPREPLLETRLRVREPLVEAMSFGIEEDTAAFVDWWFHPGTQAALTAAVARLAGKKG